MTKAEFISRVMQIMNELGWDDLSSGAFFGSNTTKVEGHIEAVFVDAWRKAVEMLPVSYFSISDFMGSLPVFDISKGTGYVLLPDDFYKLVSFRMNGWQKGAETLYESSDTIASVQANEYTRGNICRPVCIRDTERVRLSSGGGFVFELRTVLRYYSLPKGVLHEVEDAMYIPLIEPLSEDTELSEKLTTPLSYLCASMVFLIFEKGDIAKALELKAIEIIK